MRLPTQVSLHREKREKRLNVVTDRMVRTSLRESGVDTLPPPDSTDGLPRLVSGRSLFLSSYFDILVQPRHSILYGLA